MNKEELKFRIRVPFQSRYNSYLDLEVLINSLHSQPPLLEGGTSPSLAYQATLLIKKVLA